MERRWILTVLLAIGTVSTYVGVHGAEPSAEQRFLGAWKGAWAGGGTGRFDLSFERGSDGIVGSLSVDTNEGNYTIALGQLTFTGSTMSARYPYPFDQRSEIVIEGGFAGTQAQGTWALTQEGAGTMYEGTWSVRRQ